MITKMLEIRGDGQATSDAFAWHGGARTMRVAHL